MFTNKTVWVLRLALWKRNKALWFIHAPSEMLSPRMERGKHVVFGALQNTPGPGFAKPALAWESRYRERWHGCPGRCEVSDKCVGIPPRSSALLFYRKPKREWTTRPRVRRGHSRFPPRAEPGRGGHWDLQPWRARLELPSKQLIVPSAPSSSPLCSPPPPSGSPKWVQGVNAGANRI